MWLGFNGLTRTGDKALCLLELTLRSLCVKQRPTVATTVNRVDWKITSFVWALTEKKCFMINGNYRTILTWFRSSNLYCPHTLVTAKPINYQKSESLTPSRSKCKICLEGHTLNPGPAKQITVNSQKLQILELFEF